MEGEDGGWDNYKQILSARATQRLFGAADAKRELKAPFSSSNFPLPAQKNWHCVCVCMCIYNERKEETPYTCLYLRVQKAGGGRWGRGRDRSKLFSFISCMFLGVGGGGPYFSLRRCLPT